MTVESLIAAARADGWQVDQRSRIEFTGFGWLVDYRTETKRLEWWKVTVHWMVAEPVDVFAKLQELKGGRR